ncbi:MAG: thioesterase [bacterium]|nr:thioesterase [bacterium]
MSNYWIGEEKHRIRANEVDSTGYATFPALLNLMQDVAWNNSQRLGYSVYHLLEKGFTWVVSRYQFEIFNYPKHFDNVIVRSWPSSRGRLYTSRDYEILDEDRNVLISGTSLWVVLDINKRRPIPIPPFFQELKFPDDISRKEIDKSKIPEAKEESSVIKVRFQDIDMNNHTNNANYVSWVVEDLYNTIGEIRKPLYVDITFKGESVKGEMLQTFIDLMSNNESIHRIVSQNTGRDIINAHLKF